MDEARLAGYQTGSKEYRIAKCMSVWVRVRWVVIEIVILRLCH